MFGNLGTKIEKIYSVTAITYDKTLTITEDCTIFVNHYGVWNQGYHKIDRNGSNVFSDTGSGSKRNFMNCKAGDKIRVYGADTLQNMYTQKCEVFKMPTFNLSW